VAGGCHNREVPDVEAVFDLGVAHDVRGEVAAAGSCYLSAARAGHPGAMYGLAQLAYASGELDEARLWYDLAVIADGLRQEADRGSERTGQIGALLRAVAEPTRAAVDAMHRLSYYDANASPDLVASDVRLRAAADAGDPGAAHRLIGRLTARAALMTVQSWEDMYLHADLEAEIHARHQA
jgi:hypothetical protein